MKAVPLPQEQPRRGFILLAVFIILRSILARAGNVEAGLHVNWQSLLFLLTAFLVLSVGLVYFGFTRWVGIDLRQWWRFERPHIWGDIGWGLIGFLIAFALNIAVVLPVAQLGLIPEEMMNADAGTPSPGSYLLSLFFGFAIASFQEETIFRGFLQDLLDTQFSAWNANLLQAVIFAVAHIGYYPLNAWPLFLLAFLQGLVFGWLRLKRGTLVAPWIAHGLVG